MLPLRCGLYKSQNESYIGSKKIMLNSLFISGENALKYLHYALTRDSTYNFHKIHYYNR